MRAILDRLLSWFGLVLAVAMLIAGGLLTWASAFVGSQVHDQLAMQDITMPAGASIESLPAEDQAALLPFAGEPMTTGPQAKAYADHYILVHMNTGTDELFTELTAVGIDTSAFPAPLTYQSAGTVSRAIGADDTLTADQQAQGTALVADFRSGTLFTGSTLRGLLLYGYAFATMGTLAGYAAIAAFIGGAVMLLLVALGFVHARRTKQENVIVPIVPAVKEPALA